MPQPAPDNAGWVNDFVYHYRLNSEIVNEYLVSLFGDFDFRTQVSQVGCGGFAPDKAQHAGDYFRVFIPRKLTVVGCQGSLLSLLKGLETRTVLEA